MQYLLATKEFREKETHSKGLKLKKLCQSSFRQAASQVNLYHKQLIRADEAEQSNRDLGVNGRPSSLTEDGVQLFVETIRERNERQEETTKEQARDLVSRSIYSLRVIYPFY